MSKLLNLSPLLLVLGLAGNVALARAPKPGARHLVAIDGMRFSPAELEVTPGDTVVWTNNDLVPHTVTDTRGGFGSGNLGPGASFTFRVPAGPSARFEYFCKLHPSMKGTLAVQLKKK